jgi:hypothetical protein
MFVVASLSGIPENLPANSFYHTNQPWFSRAWLVDIQDLSAGTRSRIKQDYYGVKLCLDRPFHGTRARQKCWRLGFSAISG